jgi:hypothetical protein
MAVVSVGEGVDERLELVDPVKEFVGGVELVSPARLGALDAAVEIGPLAGRRAPGLCRGNDLRRRT